MAKRASKAPQKRSLRHVRGPDFRNFAVDGFMHRIEGGTVVLTPYLDEMLQTKETVVLIAEDEEAGTATYASEKIEEELQRLDLLALRVPVQKFLETAAQIAAKLQAKKVDEAPPKIRRKKRTVKGK